MPDNADEQTNGDAVDFLRFYVSEINRAGKAPGTVDFTPISVTPTCKACSGFADAQKENLVNGYYNKDDESEVTYAEIRDTFPASGSGKKPTRVRINFVLKQHPIPVFAKDEGNTPVETLTEESDETVADVRWSDGRWRLWDMGDRKEVDNYEGKNR